MISSYVGAIKLCFKTKDYIMQGQHLKKGIVIGCTVSPILFVTGINLITTAAEKITRGPVMDSGARQPVMRGSPTSIIFSYKARSWSPD